MLLGSGVLVEVKKMVVSSAALAGSWCFLGLSSWMELDQTGGHRHPMIECFWSLRIRRSAVTKSKFYGSDIKAEKYCWNLREWSAWYKTKLPMTSQL